MKRIFLATLPLIAIVGFSQPTGYTFKFELPVHDLITKIQWADINNDSLLDVVLGYRDQDSFKVSAYANMNNNPWQVQTLMLFLNA